MNLQKKKKKRKARILVRDLSSESPLVSGMSNVVITPKNITTENIFLFQFIIPLVKYVINIKDTPSNF